MRLFLLKCGVSAILFGIYLICYATFHITNTQLVGIIFIILGGALLGSWIDKVERGCK